MPDLDQIKQGEQDAFAPKILAMTKRSADGKPPDFANASFAELFAWSLAEPAAE